MSSTLSLIDSQMDFVTESIVEEMDTAVPVLSEASRYYFGLGGKRMRPRTTLLVAAAVGFHLTASPSDREPRDTEDTESDIEAEKLNLKEKDVKLPSKEEKQEDDFYAACASTFAHVLPRQRRLAEIVEMVHTASLVHDDVIDKATTRRGKPSINVHFENKVSVLCGDYLLARASVAMACLRDHRVTTLLSTVISELVEGEIVQMDTSDDAGQKLKVNGNLLEGDAFNDYLHKTYLKTASLICKSCAASAILGGANEKVVGWCAEYGENLGMAFQITDDVMDLIASDEEMGKEACVDMKLGLSTAPVLFAIEEHPELIPLIERKYSKEGDVELAHKLVMNSKGIAKSQELAKAYAKKAVAAISNLGDSEARTELIRIPNQLIGRKS